jgi:hypothetical protein
MEEKIQKLLDENNLKIDYEIVFPKFEKLPPEIELALTVLKSKGMKIRFVIKDKDSV